MPLDPRVKRFLDALAAGKPPNLLDSSVQKRRSDLAELMTLSGPAPAVARTEEFLLRGPGGPLAVRVYTPVGATAAMLPGLVYFHGGGFVSGSLATHDPIARALANGGACRVVAVDYRLAPEHPFPAALEDAVAAIDQVAADAASFGIDGTRIGICGDSAGGALAAAACQAVRFSGARPALLVLICPILDYSRRSPSRRELAEGYLIDEAMLDHDLLHYAPRVDAADPRISPLRADDLAGLPRTLIHTAEYDPVRDEGRDYFERLQRAHCEVSYTCHPGMIHLFYGLGGVIPYASTALEMIGSEIRAAFA